MTDTHVEAMHKTVDGTDEVRLGAEAYGDDGYVAFNLTLDGARQLLQSLSTALDEAQQPAADVDVTPAPPLTPEATPDPQIDEEPQQHETEGVAVIDPPKATSSG